MEKTHQSHAPGGGHMGDTSVTCTRRRSHGRHISHMHPAEVTWRSNFKITSSNHRLNIVETLCPHHASIASTLSKSERHLK